MKRWNALLLATALGVAGTAPIPFSVYAQPLGRAGDAQVKTAVVELSRRERTMLRDIARAQLAEIVMGRLALKQAQSADVKQFARWMVDDHSAALEKVGNLAQARRTKLPKEPAMKHRTAARAMTGLDAKSFETHYMFEAGVHDHRKMRDLLRRTQADAKDPDLKALAGQLLPVVEQHLAHADRLANQ